MVELKINKHETVILPSFFFNKLITFEKNYYLGMENDWVKIISSEKIFQIQIAESILKEHEIETIIINKKDSSYPTFGLIELFVNKQDVFEAIQLINKISYE